MALIKCKECGHEVSDKASACPNCGCPMERILADNESGVSLNSVDEIMPNPVNEVERVNGFNSNKLLKVLIPVLLVVLIGGISYWVWYMQRDSYQIAMSRGLIKAVQKYDEIKPFHEGLALVVKDGKYGYINCQGEEQIPCERKVYSFGGEAEDILPAFSDGMALAYTFQGTPDDFESYGSLRYGYINDKGEEVIPTRYIQAENFSEGLALVEDEDGRQAFIDKSGKTVFKVAKGICCYGSFHDGLIKCSERKNGNVKEGFMDKSGKVVIPMKYSDVRNFSEGLAFVAGDGHGAFIDTEGHEVISCDGYYDIGDFHDGLASVMRKFEDMEIGFIDKKGNVVIPITLPVSGREGGEPVLEMEYFSDGMYLVYDGYETCYFIDKTGRRLFDVNQDISATPFSEGFSVVSYRYSAYGLMDKDGNISISEEQKERVDKRLSEE